MRSHIVVSFIAISLFAVLLLPAYTIFYLQPSFGQFITSNTERYAVNLANHFGALFFPSRRPLAPEAVNGTVAAQLSRLQDEFHLVKIKVFSPDGTVIYSSDKKETGTVNTHPYFRQTVARGGVFTKVVKKNKISMEGQKMPVDVIETYVPIMRGGRFMGAFEIYCDITAQRRRLDALVHQGRNVAVAISMVLMAAAIGAAWHAHRSLLAKHRAEKALQQANDELEQRVQQRTTALENLNTTLKEEIDKRKEIQARNEQLICELTEALKKVKTLSGLLPICSSCQQIRDSEGNWRKVDEYIQRRTDAEFTHGICPACAKKLYPDLYASMEADGSRDRAR